MVKILPGYALESEFECPMGRQPMARPRHENSGSARSGVKIQKKIQQKTFRREIALHPNTHTSFNFQL